MNQTSATGSGESWLDRLLRIGPRALLALAVVLFLLLFMVLPIGSLFLASFTDQPLPLLEYLTTGRLGELISTVSENATFEQYRKFWNTPRYRQGLFNAVGVAPIAAVSVWVLGQLLGLFGFRSKWLGTPAMLAVGLVTVVWCVFFPHPLLIDGDTRSMRLLQSLGYCPLVTLFSSALGVGVAFAISRTSMPFREGFRLLTILPLSMPPFLGALAFKNLMGRFGLVTLSLESIGLSHPFASQGALSAGLVQAFLFFPFVVLTTAAALDRTDPTLGEASETLGARRGFAFWTVHLPVLLPGISAGAFLIFIRAFGDFATLKLLLPIQYSMIVVEAYRDLSGNTDWGGASTLSSIMIGVILTLLALQKYFAERGGFETVTGKAGGRLQTSDKPLVRYGALLFCVAVFSVPVAFVSATLLVSFAQNWGMELLPPSYTAGRYVKIWGELMARDESPMVNSFSLVLPALLCTVVMAFVVAFLISRSKRVWGQVLDFVTMLPFVVPGVAFAIALIGVFNRPPIELHFTQWIVILAYIVTRVPYGVRATLASFQQIGTSMEESSSTMGGTSSLTLLKVTLPLVRPGVLAGAVMVFISAMQDVAITLMTAPPDWYPASVYVFHEIEAGRIYDASAYGIVLLLLIMVPYALAFRLGAVRPGL